VIPWPLVCLLRTVARLDDDLILRNHPDHTVLFNLSPFGDGWVCHVAPRGLNDDPRFVDWTDNPQRALRYTL